MSEERQFNSTGGQLNPRLPRSTRHSGRLAVALALAGAVNTVAAWRPFARRSQYAAFQFPAVWPTSELPLHMLTWQAVIAAALTHKRSRVAKSEAAALALTAASWAGLAALEYPAKQAEAVLESALVQELGVDYRSRLVRPETGQSVLAGRTPGVVQMMRIRTHFARDCDIPYGPHGRYNLLDVWRSPDFPRSGKAPVLLQVPGGGWMTGNKQSQAYPLMSHLAARGWVCVAASYRLAPQSTWPAAIVDVKRALAWVKTHIADFGGDPDFVCITGGSAGGHLSSLAALTAADRDFQPGLEDLDLSVRATVPFYGVYDWIDEEQTGNPGMVVAFERWIVKQGRDESRETYERASPYHRITPAAPPFFVLHGTNDVMVPVESARAFVQRLREVSPQPVLYAELPRAQHAFDMFSSPRATASARAVERFLGVIYGEYVGAAARLPRRDDLTDTISP